MKKIGVTNEEKEGDLNQDAVYVVKSKEVLDSDICLEYIYLSIYI